MIALFAKNQNFNKLSNQLNSQQNSYPKRFSNPKFKGRTQCVQNHQISGFRQATRTIGLFAKNQNFNKLSNQLNSQQNSYPKRFSNPKFKGRKQCIQNHQISGFRQATRTIALFAKNQNFNKLSNQLNSQQIPNPNALSNSKPKGRTRCVQNYQSSRFRQTTRTIALFAENQISTNYPSFLKPQT